MLPDLSLMTLIFFLPTGACGASTCTIGAGTLTTGGATFTTGAATLTTGGLSLLKSSAGAASLAGFPLAAGLPLVAPGAAPGAPGIGSGLGGSVIAFAVFKCCAVGATDVTSGG